MKTEVCRRSTAKAPHLFPEACGSASGDRAFFKPPPVVVRHSISHLKLYDLFMMDRTHVAQRVPSPKARLGAGKHGLAVLDGTLLVQSARVWGAGGSFALLSVLFTVFLVTFELFLTFVTFRR